MTPSRCSTRGRSATRREKAWGATKRATEALALEARDLHLDSDRPTLVVRQGKGRKDRVVPVHPELQTALTAATSFGTAGQGRLIDVSRVTVWRWVQQAVRRATEAGQLPLINVNYSFRPYCLTRECYRNSSPYFPPQPRLIPPSRSVPMQVHQMWSRPASWP